MDMPMSDLGFRGMSLLFKLRDLVVPRREILEEVGIKPGSQVLDYGCGPGGYIAEISRLVGSKGKVYALDIHLLAVKRIQDLARKRRLTNVGIIHSGCKTGLPDNSLDVVLLYDVFHDLSDPQVILAELHRVLKPDGTLSFSDHHMSQEEIVSGVTKGQLFRLTEMGLRTCSFRKQM